MIEQRDTDTPDLFTGRMTFGYARVSTKSQDFEGQIERLQEAGCNQVFAEKATGRHQNRPELQRMMDKLRAGDVVIVTRLDRLARSTRDLLALVEQIHETGATFKSLSEPWADTTTPAGKMVMTIFAGVAEFERSLIAERTTAGIKEAKKRGKKPGPPAKLTPERRATVLELLNSGKGASEVARIMDVHRSSIYRIIREEEDKKLIENKD
ncbi:recombinase family protein [Thiopseudomonas alkaliphila]|uniref:recombinase family protein n=1 Tax=Gammaproteobacteria TaxID=1236 RepID=UPI00257773EA|nr:recombinase family protein [Thiopseudomonas alkaliphila]MDM1708929.1 recombinase family protein [Thiopseudomonas alkaliphila]